jgi:hypothetical protein
MSRRAAAQIRVAFSPGQGEEESKDERRKSVNSLRILCKSKF